MKILFLFALLVSSFGIAKAETTKQKSKVVTSADWPVDCPRCPVFKKGQRQNYTGGNQISSNAIIDHVNALLHYFPPGFIDPKVAVCIAKKESKMYSGAINGGSSARGLYQVLIGTGRAALNERPCKGKMPYTWSTMSVSTRAQTFMFLCVAYMKAREAGRSKFDEKAVRRYHGNKKESINSSYLKSVRSKGCNGVI